MVNLIKIKSFFQGLFLFLFVIAVANWIMAAILLQFFLPFSFVFLLYDIVVFILAVYIPFGAKRNRWCRRMLVPQESDWLFAVMLILATIINIIHWNVVSLMLLGLLGLS